MFFINLINLIYLIKILLIIKLTLVYCERVKVKIYDHRALHDSVEKYGSGVPWNYYGYGYGLEYQYEPNGKYERQKGYGFVKAYGRDFCKDKANCSPQTVQKEHQSTDHALLNLNHLDHLNFNEPNSITNSVLETSTKSSDNSVSSNGQVIASDKVIVKEPQNHDDKLNNDVDYITRIYNLNKNAELPDTLKLNLVDTNAPNHLMDKFKLNNKLLDGLASNSVSSNLLVSSKTVPKSDSMNSLNLSPNKFNQIDHQRTLQYTDLQNGQQLNQKESNFKRFKQNSQLINTMNRPIYLASSHYYENDDESYDEYNHDPFAENFKIPKFVHSAAKQLKHFSSNHYSSTNEFTDHNYRSNYKNSDYDDEFDSHLLGASRLQPKFLKSSSSKLVKLIQTDKETVTVPKRTLLNKEEDNLNKSEVNLSSAAVYSKLKNSNQNSINQNNSMVLNSEKQ